MASAAAAVVIYTTEVGHWAKLHDHYIVVQTQQCEARGPTSPPPRNCAAEAKAATAWIAPFAKQLGAFEAVAYIIAGWVCAFIVLRAGRWLKRRRAPSAIN
jgi:hypothetical protein